MYSCVPRPQDGAVGLSLEHVSVLWCIQTGVRPDLGRLVLDAVLFAAWDHSQHHGCREGNTQLASSCFMSRQRTHKAMGLGGSGINIGSVFQFEPWLSITILQALLPTVHLGTDPGLSPF